MIVKGTAVKSATHAGFLARHLLNPLDNEICQVWDIEGHARPDDLKAALLDFHETKKLTKGNAQYGLFMVSINPEKGQHMDKDRYLDAVARSEKAFNLEGQPKALVYHCKKDEKGEMRGHLHVVWQTTDLETRTNKARLLKFGLKCKSLARDLELEFQHKPVANDKSKVSYDDREREQARQSDDNRKPDRRKKAIQTAFEQSKDGKDFAQRLEILGYKAARGKVGICIIDPSGQVYNLEKELKGKVKQEELETLFADQKLADANTIARELKNKDKITKKKPEPTGGIEASPKKAEYLIHGIKREELAAQGVDMTQAAKQAKEEENALDKSQDLDLRMLKEQERKETIRKLNKFTDNFSIAAIPFGAALYTMLHWSEMLVKRIALFIG